jgi:hypothetical protein
MPAHVPPHPRYLEPELVFLVGTAHVSAKSADDVARVVEVWGSGHRGGVCTWEDEAASLTCRRHPPASVRTHALALRTLRTVTHRLCALSAWWWSFAAAERRCCTEEAMRQCNGSRGSYNRTSRRGSKRRRRAPPAPPVTARHPPQVRPQQRLALTRCRCRAPAFSRRLVARSARAARADWCCGCCWRARRGVRQVGGLGLNSWGLLLWALPLCVSLVSRRVTPLSRV